MVTQTRSVRVKNLPNYMKCLNNKKCAELGWQSPFEVYFGRKSNELVRCSLLENRGFPEVRKVRNQQKMISIDFKNCARKQENEHLIPTKGLQKEQLDIKEKGINVLCTK